MFLGNKYYMLEILFISPLNQFHVRKESTFVAWAAELSMWVKPWKTWQMFSANAKLVILLLTLVLTPGTWGADSQVPD